MFENKFVSLPSRLKTIEPMEVHRELRTMCNTETSKVISRTDPMIDSLNELRKMELVRNYLISNQAIDADGFVDYLSELL